MKQYKVYLAPIGATSKSVEDFDFYGEFSSYDEVAQSIRAYIKNYNALLISHSWFSNSYKEPDMTVLNVGHPTLEFVVVPHIY